MTGGAWDDWIGRTTQAADDIVRSPARRLAATLGDWSVAYRDGDTELPPLWHWGFFLEATPRGEIGVDGHAAKGGFLPPIDLPRRMYAGGRFTFPGALAYGRLAEKRTTIASITEKSGRSGRLAFVTVRHEFIQDGQVATTEEHDIVYREAAEPGALVPPAPRATALDVATREIVTPDPVLLFCFSALTFNGHRIHYDQPYVTGTEGYPGLVVHGPLVAILLFEKARRDYPGARPSGFSFRAMSPVFCGSEVHLVGLGKQGDAAPYEARTADDTLIMTSTIDFA